jgi:enoyl-CoA hydratase/carnithine racemase
MNHEQSPATYQFILYEVKDGIARLTLNQPNKLNAFHLPMYGEICDALDAASLDYAVRVIIIKGAGRAFSAGRDFKFSADLQTERGISAWRRGYKGFSRSTSSNLKLIIAQVHGYALGGAGTLALLSDLTFAAAGTKFGYPETRHGIASKTMMWSWTLGLKVANEVVASGRLVTADECKHLRLVNEVLPADLLEPHVEAVARRIADAPEGVPELIKRTVNWAIRDQIRVTQQDRAFDVDTAHWDAAGVEPSDWMLNAYKARRAALMSLVHDD